MGRPKNAQPSYLEHKPSGQARVRINGVDHYLGPYRSPESLQKYNQLMVDLAAGRPINGTAKPATGRLTVSKFIEAYTEFAQSYYSQKSGERYRIRSSVAP